MAAAMIGRTTSTSSNCARNFLHSGTGHVVCQLRCGFQRRSRNPGLIVGQTAPRIGAGAHSERLRPAADTERRAFGDRPAGPSVYAHVSAVFAAMRRESVADSPVLGAQAETAPGFRVTHARHRIGAHRKKRQPAGQVAPGSLELNRCFWIVGDTAVTPPPSTVSLDSARRRRDA